MKETQTNSSFNLTFTIVLLGAIVFFISLALLPKTPKVDKVNVSIEIAKQKIKSGQVMEGVTMLKTVLDSNENNVDAIWELGKLSMESNQFEKAQGRFIKFVSLTSGNDKASGLISLADAYFLNGEVDKALAPLLEARKHTEEQSILIEIDERIGIINKK